MGLYDDRLSALSEPRHSRRVAQRRPPTSAPRNPMLRPGNRRLGGELHAARRPSMAAQSLLFDRSAGWTVSKAKAWAKSHGYLYGKVDVTDQYVRIRQFDPKGFKVKRTIPFGRGIRAVVAREESSMRTVKAPRRRTSKKKARKTAARKRPRRARKVKALGVATRRKRRKVRVEARKSTRRRVRRTSHVMEATRRRRRRPARASEAWKGDSAGHAKAARKGHKRRRAARKTSTRRRRRNKTRETTYAAAPKRRRHSRRAREATPVMEAKRSRRRSYRAHAKSRGGGGMGPGALALMVVSGGFGFVFADGLDRMLATYNPAETDATKRPKDKFTSDGAGTLANTLNVASRPGLGRLAAAVGITAAPAVGAMFVENTYVRGSLEGLAIGSGINLFKTVWNSFLMPLLIGKDTTTPTLQKSYIARLYPAEVAASINMRKTDDTGAARTPQMAVSPATSGLSDQPAAGVGAPDVGPFALAAESPYPDAAAALRSGVSGDSPYPDAAAALRSGIGGSSPYPDAAAALRAAAGLSAPYEPGPPPGVGPGPQAAPHSDPSCGCIGESNPFLGFIGDEAATAA